MGTSFNRSPNRRLKKKYYNDKPTDLANTPILKWSLIDKSSEALWQQIESQKKAMQASEALVKELYIMNENKNQFLSMLSHELRNLLASIMMSLSRVFLISIRPKNCTPL